MAATANASSRPRILSTVFRKDFATSKPRLSFVPESSDFDACGSQGSNGEEDWASMVLEQRLMWPFKWRGIGKLKFMLQRATRGIRSWRWSWEPSGQAERLTSRRKSWMPQL